MRWVAIVALIALGVGSYARAEVIRFASAVYPPFTMLNNHQEPCGFDVDIARLLCEKINVDCSFNIDKFTNLVSSLNSRKYDAWISAITICNGHKKNVVFTRPYFSSTALLIATKDTIFDAAPAGIKGKIIGVADHTCYIQYLKNTYGDTVTIKTFPTEDESFLALKKGLVDAVIDDAIVIRKWRLKQRNKDKYRLIGLPAKYSELVWHKYGIAVAKNNQLLVNRLDAVIDQIKADGTYQKLVDKYFAN